MDQDRLLAVLDRLRPGLELVWEDRTEPPEDRVRFFDEAHHRAVEELHELAGEEDFIPAGLWESEPRDLLLEHLRDEVDALIGGVKTEEIWQSFSGVPATEQITELVVTGILIKFRAVGAFLVLPASRYGDELTAADFFPADGWEAARTDELAARVLDAQELVHKQIAQVTITRPFPEEKWVARGYSEAVEPLITLLEDFTRGVDPSLVPDWWTDWIAQLRPRLREDVRRA